MACITSFKRGVIATGWGSEHSACEGKALLARSNINNTDAVGWLVYKEFIFSLENYFNS